MSSAVPSRPWLRGALAILCLLGADWLAACAEAPPPDLTGASADGVYQIAVRWDPGPLPFNEPFAALIDLSRDGQPVEGATLGVSAWMPGHGHGMLRYPRVTERGAGRYRAEGLLFHMRGHWELRLDVVVDRLATRAVLPVDLP